MTEEQRVWVGKHQDSKATRHELLLLTCNHKMSDCRELNIGTNVSVEDDVIDRIVASAYCQGLTCITMQEVGLSPESIARLLELPKLDSLVLAGGSSSDYGGATYVYPTLGPEHIQAILDSPHRHRLRDLDFPDQGLGSASLLALRAAIPELVSLKAWDINGSGQTKEGTLEPGYP